tara:strand:- start:1383 stop:1550 length:168 start_codon:yes stop_codon:yes gene_type:complete
MNLKFLSLLEIEGEPVGSMEIACASDTPLNFEINTALNHEENRYTANEFVTYELL